MKKICVYTVIVGGYDAVRQPEVIDDRFDYILFCDFPVEDPGIWQVRPVTFDSKERWLKSRFPRVNPHIVLAEYDAWLYIDGNITITSPYVYERCISLYEQQIDWAGIVHPGRDCTYDEIDAITGLKWVHDYEVLDWVNFLHKEGFPQHLGLYENNIIFRCKTPCTISVNEYWWRYLSRFKVRRDQFVVMFALSKAQGLKRTNFLPAGQSAWNNDGHFKHAKHLGPEKSKELPFSLWEKLRYRYVKRFYCEEGDWHIHYCQWFKKLSLCGVPHLAMHLWTIWIALRYDSALLFRRGLSRITGRR